MINTLKDWIEENRLDVSFKSDNILEINNESFLLVSPKDKVLDKDFSLNLTEQEHLAEVDNYLFEFGGQYYYTPSDQDEAQMIPFKYLGECTGTLETDYAFLGIHGGYELLNGSRQYSDWCKKAKFYNIDTLGICEKNTLAGAMLFQLACQKNDVKSIIGEEITIKRESKKFIGKVYVLNEKGWLNLLAIHKEIKVINEGFIEEKRLLELTKGLVYIFHYDDVLDRKTISSYQSLFDYCFYQLDTVIWNSEQKDKEFLLKFKNYIDNFSDQLEPILINDAYYLDKDDFPIKDRLNTILGQATQNLSENQYFKDPADNFSIIKGLFKDEDKSIDLFLQSIENTNLVKIKSDFKIQTGVNHWPEFNLENGYSEYESKEDLIWSLIQEGIETRIDTEKYDIDTVMDRVEKEMAVIEKGGFRDYFLILYDICKWCRENDILIGVGRGSAGGSLISAILGITNINPLDYDLLFERFLNEGRLGPDGSPADIDIDIESHRRDEVKRYIEEKYGQNHVCSVGTYTTLQLKAALKDIARTYGVPAHTMDYLSKKIQLTTGQTEDDKWEDIFMNGVKNKTVRDFIRHNSGIINDIRLCITQPRSSSIHACAMIIFPKKKDIFSWIPVRKEGDELVSEWGGKELEKAGFLKMDILGIRQLDKFRSVINLVKDNIGDDINIYNIPLNEEGVYEVFQKGLTEDSFQFGSAGLKGYCRDVFPTNIHDLIAINALFRPGPMLNGMHLSYVKLKNGIKEPEYDFGLREVTDKTYGIYIYQEQIIKASQVLGGFSLVEADDVRRAMGKKIQSLIDKYGERFVKGAIERGCEVEEAEKIWSKMEKFASYSFNASHSAAYAITGYISMWMKYHYPLAFWITALEFADKGDILRYISEINKMDDVISIAPPDINNSGERFKADFEKNKIYWSLTNIKNVGPVSINAIFEDRNKNGNYYSLVEFMKRVPKNKCNKQVMESLILAGVFDEVEEIKSPKNRFIVLKKYYKNAKIDEKSENTITYDVAYNNKKESTHDWWWTLKQKALSNLGLIDYQGLVKNDKDFSKYNYVDATEFFFKEEEGYEKKNVVIAGILQEYKEKNSKRGPFGQIVIDSNDELIDIIAWNESWHDVSGKFTEKEGSILIITGSLVFDTFRKKNVLHSSATTKLKFI